MTRPEPIDPVAAAERAGVRIRAAEPEDIEAISATMSDPGVIHGTLQVPFTSVALRRERFVFADAHTLFLTAEPLDGGVRAVFLPTVPLDELMRLIAAEQDCCQFLSFAITVDTRGVALQVTAPADALAMVHSLFGAPA